jgi:TolB-like protein/DNA-binding winged helix-turn-helix (wHTH) protein/Tfp pilus assembly protein PilF
MSGARPHVIYEFGDFRLDAGRSLLFARAGSEPLPVKPKVLDTLLYFVERPGELLEKDRLLADLWPGLVVEESNLTHVVSVLRRILGEVRGENVYIVTVPGRGYRFVAQVLRRESSASESLNPRTPSRRTSRLGLVVAAALGASVLAFGWVTGWWDSPRTPAQVESTLPPRSVAILAFESLSQDPQDMYVADGLAESVLHRLANIPDLTLIARTSSFALRGQRADARDIGRRLNARYLVEGSVARSGERLRVTAQLIDATTGSHVWSLRFDREMGDIFAVEDEIAQNVARALEVSLRETVHPHARYGIDAYLAFMQGRALVASRKVVDAERAIERFARAIEIAPAFAAAHLALADAHLHLAQLTDERCSSPQTRLAHRNAEPLLARALEIDPSLGEAYVLRAGLKDCSGDAAGAEADFRKGLTLSPSYGRGHERLAEFFNVRGRDAEAFAAIDQARSVDPLTPRHHYLKGLMLNTDDAIKPAEALYLQALEVAPDFHPALMRLAEIRAFRQARTAEGIKLAEQAVAIDPRAPWMLLRPAHLYLELEDVEAARAFAAEQPKSTRAALWLPICLFAGQPERAADILRANPNRWSDTLAEDVEAYVVRDAGFASRQLARARTELAALPASEPDLFRKVALAQISLALGDREAAEKLARQVVTESEQPGMHQPRAIALAVLGEHDAAMERLERAFARGAIVHWWYMLDREPAFEPLRDHPRFEALAARVRAHASAQRRLLEDMRERSEVPRRTRHPAGIAPC